MATGIAYCEDLIVGEEAMVRVVSRCARRDSLDKRRSTALKLKAESTMA